MRIAPRTLLCGNALRVHVTVAGDRFEELRELCTAAGDKASLAIGMAGLVMDTCVHGRMREASRLASENMALIESIGDPTLTVGLSIAAIDAKLESRRDGRGAAAGRRRVIDLADGDPAKGNFVVGSPLGGRVATRALPVWALGRAGWRDDFDRAWPWPRSGRPDVLRRGRHYVYVLAIRVGCCCPTTPRCATSRRRLTIAERSGDDLALGVARWALGVALVHRDGPRSVSAD